MSSKLISIQGVKKQPSLYKFPFPLSIHFFLLPILQSPESIKHFYMKKFICVSYSAAMVTWCVLNVSHISSPTLVFETKQPHVPVVVLKLAKLQLLEIWLLKKLFPNYHLNATFAISNFRGIRWKNIRKSVKRGKYTMTVFAWKSLFMFTLIATDIYNSYNETMSNYIQLTLFSYPHYYISYYLHWLFIYNNSHLF